MKAERLPSGSYRYRVSYYDAEGKRRQKSFSDVDREVAKQAALSFAQQHRRPVVSSGSFGVLLTRYIDARRPNLSPATIRGYENMKKRLQAEYPLFYGAPLCSLQKFDVQDLLNGIASSSSPKTVRNFSGLISGVFRENDAVLGQITLPRKTARQICVPSEHEVRALIAAAKDPVRIPVMLGAFAGLRRGEVCALKMSDIDFDAGVVHVCRDVVLDSNNKWIVKPPKTIASDRFVELPPEVLEAIRSAGVIFPDTPLMLHYHFHKLCMEVLGKSYRFHDLRHFCASWMHSLGVPDAYIMQRCGWSNDGVLKAIYRHTLADQERQFVALTNSSFSSFFVAQDVAQ